MKCLRLCFLFALFAAISAAQTLPKTVQVNATTNALTTPSASAFRSANAIAGTGTGLSQFSATTSSELAAVVSDETGSGAAVFGTSPTLTTPTIDRINGGTVNGDITLAPNGTGRIAYAYSDAVRLKLGRYPWEDSTPGQWAAIDGTVSEDDQFACFFWRARRSRGTIDAPTATQELDILTGFSAMGYDGTYWGGTASHGHSDITLDLKAAENFTTSSHATFAHFRLTNFNETSKRAAFTFWPTGDLYLHEGGERPGNDFPAATVTGAHITSATGRTSLGFTGTVFSSSATTDTTSFIGRRARGLFGVSAAAVQAGDYLARLLGVGYDGSAFVNGPEIRFLANQTWTGSARGNYIDFVTTTNGATNATIKAKLWDTGSLVLSPGLTNAEGPYYGYHILHQNDTGYFATVASNSAGTSARVMGLRSRGTLTSQSAIQADDVMFTIQARGHNGTSMFNGASASIAMYARENWTSSAQGTYVIINTTATGSTTNAQVARFDSTAASFAKLVQAGTYTVSQLPTASSYPGGMAYVTDLTSTSRGDTATGGGSSKWIVFSNGTNWLVL